jgi:hypothetical protein
LKNWGEEFPEFGSEVVGVLEEDGTTKLVVFGGSSSSTDRILNGVSYVQEENENFTMKNFEGKKFVQKSFENYAEMIDLRAERIEKILIKNELQSQMEDSKEEELKLKRLEEEEKCQFSQIENLLMILKQEQYLCQIKDEKFKELYNHLREIMQFVFLADSEHQKIQEKSKQKILIIFKAEGMI